METESILFSQVLPQSRLDHASFMQHAKQFRSLLKEQGEDPTWYCNSFNPYPLSVSAEHFERQKRLQVVLHRVLTAVVQNYFHNNLLQEWLSLPEGVFASLKTLCSYPFRIGSYRPDFLHTEENRIVICEINARFPANAYLISNYLNNIVTSPDYLRASSAKDATAETTAPKSFSTLHDTANVFADYFAQTKTIHILAGREKGWDRHFLVYELTKRGHEVEITTKPPEALAEYLEAALTKNRSRDPASESRHGLFLEFHQDELLANGLLDFICSNYDRFTCLNDPRSIFILHDKRLLALLCDRDKLKAFLSDDDAEFLSSHIVPTWIVRHSPDIVATALANRVHFVLKPNLFGKGEGIIFGATSSQEAFRAALSNEESGDYVLQSLIAQKKTPIYMDNNGSLKLCPVNIVGTLLCFANTFLGPGIYRASPSAIVNVAGGGTILTPMLAHTLNG